MKSWLYPVSAFLLASVLIVLCFVLEWTVAAVSLLFLLALVVIKG